MSAWRMPAETDPHERTWMAWPSSGYTLGDTRESAEEARATWAAVANTVVEYEPLIMYVDPAALGHARAHLSGDVEIRELPLDDAWFRDIGPTFVLDETGRLGGVDWTFNGWGQQAWASWEHDQFAALAATELAGATHIGSRMVNEGGGIHTDGLGTFLVTETVQLDPGRNPGWTKERVEEELARTVGARTVIWLPRGLTRDSSTFGTRGHVDLLATFAAPGRVLAHVQRDAAHPDAEVSEEILSVLRAATDADGRPLEVIELPAPEALRDDEGWVDHTYVNHYVLNGAVLACAYDDPADDRAAEILRAAYPGRTVVPLDARPLFARGGGIHCITQQQPKGTVR